jgi:hypothetical protein
MHVLSFPPVALVLQLKPKQDVNGNLIVRFKIPGFQPNTFLLFPTTASSTYTHHSTGSVFKYHRRGYLASAGYSFTGFGAQGRTFNRAVVDIAKPYKLGNLTSDPLTPYILTSRVRSFQDLQIVRPFPKELSACDYPPEQNLEMKLLSQKNHATRSLYNTTRLLKIGRMTVSSSETSTT